MPELTPYEAGQVGRIAAWKAERPGRVAEAVGGLARPLARLVSKAVPRHLVRRILAAAEAQASRHDRVADLLRQAGASSLAELRDRPLEVCDGLAAGVGARAELRGLLQGVLPSLAGVAVPGASAVAAAFEVPLILQAALGAIRRTGHCYGYPLEGPEDRDLIVRILDIANTDDPRERQAECEAGGVADPGLGRPTEVAAVEDAMTQDLVLDAVPLAGDVAPLVLDYAFLRRVDEAARRVFQERWLRDRGKVASIAPSPVGARHDSREEAAVIAAQLGYVGAYLVGFGVALPASALAAGLARLPLGPAGAGARDGAADAARDAARSAGGLRPGLATAAAAV